MPAVARWLALIPFPKLEKWEKAIAFPLLIFLLGEGKEGCSLQDDKSNFESLKQENGSLNHEPDRF